MKQKIINKIIDGIVDLIYETVMRILSILCDYVVEAIQITIKYLVDLEVIQSLTISTIPYVVTLSLVAVGFFVTYQCKKKYTTQNIYKRKWVMYSYSDLNKKRKRRVYINNGNYLYTLIQQFLSEK